MLRLSYRLDRTAFLHKKNKFLFQRITPNQRMQTVSSIVQYIALGKTKLFLCVCIPEEKIE